ncbi:histone acetyltransferase, MYST family [Microthyrium microscopicum]|uniref:histone acetyltransferase n=1 Tax=Microthyrium microscopicum TaxID=703497 RepID=A0A6A6TXP5_9PEZI|nr:histone acetyltransferase, MYST family [Microthyrium microscopicum]
MSASHNSQGAIAIPPSPQQGHRRRISTAPTQKNVKEVILTDLRIEAWYPSFYPEELIGKLAERLFVCKWCFKYTTKLIQFMEHSKCCELQTPGSIGTLLYEKGAISIYEVDGEENKLFAQNLSLFAKLFLDTKSVFYDVTTFLYYILYHQNPEEPNEPPRIVGFFSKEKLSWDSNNLACICIFPPWQKLRFGQILMGVSYELSKSDGRLGGPEKPLSELGRKAYIHYWAATIARLVVRLPAKKKISVQEITEATSILPEDIIATLKEMDLMERKRDRDGHAYVNKSAVISWMAMNRVDMMGPVDENAFVTQETIDE